MISKDLIQHTAEVNTRLKEVSHGGSALVGGLALGAHTEARFTRDVDFVVSVIDDNRAEVVIRHMLSNGYQLIWNLEDNRTGRIAGVRLCKQGSLNEIVDLIFSTTGIEPEIVAGAKCVTLFDNAEYNVASRGHMIAMKLLSRSEQRVIDNADLKKLLKRADENDLSVATEAITLIEQRGTNRGKDLLEELRQEVLLLQRAAKSAGVHHSSSGISCGDK